MLARNEAADHHAGEPGPVPIGRALRRALRAVAGEVAIVTALDDAGPQGMTATSITSVSMAPPTMLVCLLEGARTTATIERTGRFCINYLRAGQEALAERFARRGEDRFQSGGYDLRDDVPVLSDCLASVTCEVVERFRSTNHQIVVGRVVASRLHGGRPLLRFDGRYVALAGEDPGDLLTYQGETSFNPEGTR